MKKLFVLFVLGCTALCAHAKTDYATKASSLTRKTFEAIGQSNAKKVKSLLKKNKNQEALTHYLYMAAYVCADGVEEEFLRYHYPRFNDAEPDAFTFENDKPLLCDKAQNEEIIRLLIDAGARTDALTYYVKNEEPLKGSDKKQVPLGLQTILHFLKKGNPEAIANLLPKLDKCMVYLTEMTDATPDTTNYTAYAKRWKQNHCTTDNMLLIGEWSPDKLPFVIRVLSEVFTSDRNHALTLGKTERELTALYQESPLFTRTVSPSRKMITYRKIQPAEQDNPQGDKKAVDYIYTLDNGIATHVAYVVLISHFSREELWDRKFVTKLKSTKYY